MLSRWHPFISGVVDSSRSVMNVLYTFSCNISHALLSTGFKSSEFGGHRCSGINSGVSLGNNWYIDRPFTVTNVYLPCSSVINYRVSVAVSFWHFIGLVMSLYVTLQESFSKVEFRHMNLISPSKRSLLFVSHCRFRRH